jgi:hypothetical protein
VHDLLVDLIAIRVCGALGGFANVFIGDSGLHLPTIRPGYIGVVFVGLIAAVGAWLATQDSALTGNLVPVAAGDAAAL